MDSNTALVWVAVLAVVAYVLRLVVLERGDFEARGRSGDAEFVLKAKERSK